MMRLITVFLLFLTITVNGQNEEREIREVMALQEECWNEGDLECFMEGYWKSEKLVFIGNSGLTYGWQKILDNYRESYPTKDKMGTLKFDILIMEPLSKDFWSVIGKWSLQRENDNPNGHFSLLFRLIGDEWLIVSDHSS